MDFRDLLKFRESVSIINSISGKQKRRAIIPSEKKSRLNARRSLYALGNIDKYTKISEKISSQRDQVEVFRQFFIKK